MTDYPFDIVEDICEDVNSEILDAARGDNLAVLKALSQCQGADVNTQETPCTGSEGKGVGCGRTPLWWAVFHENLPMAEFLLEYPGAFSSIDDVQKFGKSEDWYKETQMTPLVLACSDGEIPGGRGDPAMLKLMLKYPIFQSNLNRAGGPSSYTPLMKAAIQGDDYENIVLVLLADPNMNVNTKGGYFKDTTALHVAALNGRSRIVDILLRCSKTDINIKDRFNKNALDRAKDGLEDAQERCRKEQRYCDSPGEYIKTIELLEKRAAGETLLGGSTC